MHLRAITRPLLFIFALLVACGDDTTEPVPMPVMCTPDPELIASAPDCVVDDHCPCGSHCVLGRCAAECLTGAECAGGVCDAFGRCRGMNEAALVPVPSPLAEAAAITGLRTPGESALASEGRRYGARVLARWLRAHAFVASEALERDLMSAVFAGTGVNESPGLEPAFEQSMQAWELFFHPRIAGSLDVLPAEDLVEPDYREPILRSSNTVVDEQRVALPIVVMDTLARQAELLAKRLEYDWRHGTVDATAPVRDFLPRATYVQALAHSLDAHARESSESYRWRPEMESAVARFHAQQSGLIAMVNAIERGDNPLGIEDGDLPLYFLDQMTGAGGRFAAVSDFLIGSGPGSNAWAPALVSQASSDLDDARDIYIRQLDRDYMVARDRSNHGTWVIDVRAEYNAALRDFCGPTSESLVDDPTFQAESCAINTSDPGCAPDPTLYYQSWSNDDLGFRFCQHELLRSDLDEDRGFISAAMREVYADCWSDGDDDSQRNVMLVSCGSGVCVECDGHEVELTQLGALDVVLPDAADDAATRQLVRDAFEQCQMRFPDAQAQPFLPTSSSENPSCVSGSIGEAFLDLVTADRDIELARAELAERLEAYDIAVESCNILASAADEAASLRDAHADRMAGLRREQANADEAAAASAFVKECAATMAGMDKGLLGFVGGTIASGVACAAGGAEQISNVLSIDLGEEIENAIQAHENQLAALEDQAEIEVCYNDASQELVGMRSASIAIEQALFDAERAQGSLGALQADANRTWAEGHEYLAEIEAFPLTPPGGDRWANERITRYHRKFRQARRTTYLAVRAVEYEFQASLPAREQALRAETPSDLDAVLSDLWATAGTRSIGGSRPSELHIVLSLRDDILQLQDETAEDAGLHPLNRVERFRLALASPEHAVYDESGRYLGQKIPFSLAPLSSLGRSPGGVSIYGSTDCAERLWSVNASVLGADPYEGSDTSFVRMDILKSNTFYSQWCDPGTQEEPYQVASVRPGRNLFREPGVGEAVGSMFGTEIGVATETRARIQAFFGVERAELEDTVYANGETSELAARGLFGDYALFVPAELIAREASSGGYRSRAGPRRRYSAAFGLRVGRPLKGAARTDHGGWRGVRGGALAWGAPLA